MLSFLLSLFCCQSNAENPDPKPIVEEKSVTEETEKTEGEAVKTFEISKEQTVKIAEGFSITHKGTSHKHRVDGGADGFLHLNIQQYDETGLRKYELDSWAEESFNDELYRIRVYPHVDRPLVVTPIQGKEKALTQEEAAKLLSFPEKCGGIHMISEHYGVFKYFTDKGCQAVVGSWSHEILEQDNILPGECE